jgi:putative drug exporter of the RND superfamily
MLAAVIPFATTDLITVREFGLGVAIAVVLDAAIVRPVLLPAAVEVLGRRSWWPTSSAAPLPPSRPTQPPMARPAQPVAGGRA